MNDSILTSIKKLLGIEESYTHFDLDIIFHINTVFSTLTQLGVGPVEGFSIEDASTTWKSYVASVDWNMLRSYLFLRVRLLFDPPQNSFLVNAMEKQILEFEWRLVVKGDVDTPDE